MPEFFFFRIAAINACLLFFTRYFVHPVCVCTRIVEDAGRYAPLRTDGLRTALTGCLTETTF